MSLKERINLKKDGVCLRSGGGAVLKSRDSRWMLLIAFCSPKRQSNSEQAR